MQEMDRLKDEELYGTDGGEEYDSDMSSNK